MLHLTDLQKQLCDILQQDLPLCSDPFAEIAQRLNTSAETVISQTNHLLKTGLIRRIGPVINQRSLGRTTTLVAAHIEAEILDEVIDTVNQLPGVTHNYLRGHHYNLWFTLTCVNMQKVRQILKNLASRFQTTFHNLPAGRIFKLNVTFNTDSRQRTPSQTAPKLPLTKTARLTKNEKTILEKLTYNIAISASPFALLSDTTFSEQKILTVLNQLKQKGVIRRIAAILDHRRLGFTANVLLVCSIDKQELVKTAAELACLPTVTHCYERETFPGWPYNLYAMMHDKNISQIRRRIRDFCRTENITSFQLLPTIAELKKQPVKYQSF